MPLNAQVTLSVLSHESTVGAIARNVRVTPVSYATALADGTGAGQAQIAWSAARTLSGTTETLTASALPDTRDGAAVSVGFTAVKVFYLRNTHATLPISANTTMLAEGAATVPPGGVLFFSAPTADGRAAANIVVSAASGGATYEIAMIGTGAAT